MEDKYVIKALAALAQPNRLQIFRSLVVKDGRLTAYPITDAWPTLLKEGLYLAMAEARTTDIVEPSS